MNSLTWLMVLSSFCYNTHTFRIHLTGNKDFELSRFWTSTGFCPGPPRDTISVLSSDDVVQNLIRIAALPRHGLKYVRIHWVFDLVSWSALSTVHQPVFNFTRMDQLYDLYLSLDLYPHVEFMRSSKTKRDRLSWTQLIIQFLQHSINRYSLKLVNRWRFETWNEPDLKMYNTMEWQTVDEYLSYISQVQNAFGEIKRRYPNFQAELRGPAGTFKSPDSHPFCYGVLKLCQANTTGCPFDILTFHRKGTTGRAKQILKGEMELLKELEVDYPFLKARLWSNSEADPTIGWSIPLSSNTGIEYAREVISNIFYHWTAMNRGHSARRLDSISQDNAFLSFHPHEFSQRTLLARFQMNETVPRYSEFIEKPVYAAHGFLSNLGSRADLVRRRKGLTILKSTSRSDSYYAIIIAGSKLAQEKLNVNFTGFDTKKSFGVLIEVLENDKRDPYSIWHKHGSPAYPNAQLLEAMRHSQTPKIFYSGPMGSYLKIQGNFKAPFLMMVRLCDKRTMDKWIFRNVSFHMVHKNSVLIHWGVEQKGFNCLKGFHVYFRPEGTKSKRRMDQWIEISYGYHIPWHSFQYSHSNGTIYGDYKIKAVEIFSNQNRYSPVFKLRQPG